VVGQLLTLVQRYPPLVDGAFIIIGWVGTKLCLEYLHTAGLVAFEIPQWLSITLIVVIFTAAFVYARAQGPVENAGLEDRVGEVMANEAEPSTPNSQS
jgi:predicted tellurium resistance membrane protein TerC